MKTAILKLNINQAQIIKTLCFAIVLTILSYIYMVNAVAFNVASRQDAVNLSSVLSSHISDLELVAREKSAEVNREMAYEMGLTVDAEDEKIFVLRNQNTRLTFNE